MGSLFIDEYGLSPKERAFVDEYIKDFNGTEAYRRVYPGAEYASKTVNNLLTKPHIKAAIGHMTTRIAKRRELNVDRVLDEWQAIAFSDLGNYLRKDGFGRMVVDLSKLEPGDDASRALSQLVQEELPTKEGSIVMKTNIKLHDKLKALEFLSKFLGMDKPTQIEISGPNGGPIQTESSIDLSVLTLAELEALNSMAEKVQKEKKA